MWYIEVPQLQGFVFKPLSLFHAKWKRKERNKESKIYLESLELALFMKALEAIRKTEIY